MSFISSLPLYEIVSYRSRVYKNPILELMILLHSNILTIHGQVIKSTFLKKIKLSDNSTDNFCSFFILTSVKPLILFALYRFQISILFSKNRFEYKLKGYHSAYPFLIINYSSSTTTSTSFFLNPIPIFTISL